MIVAKQEEISAGLKRNLKSGKEYNKLIPSVKCERTNLGDGDTFKTVNWMKDWIEKYSFQTVKLSTKLQSRSLQETVNNIYQFLYDHVQYTADGPLQQLRSPACTWAQRKDGVDCKSYSVFASSILSNLGIKHFIRQIRQASFYPQEFTHVYIVVPLDQSGKNYQKNTPTYVLDATKHQNTESNYLEKVDLHMVNLRHIGLNAPQDERTQKIVENFEKFSKHLLQNGIPLSTVNGMRERVSLFTNSGKDPSFKIIDQGIIIERKFFPLNFKTIIKQEQPQEQGLGVLITGTAAIAGGKAIMKMLPPGFIDDTFGAIFANGFDLSCWGGSNSPSKSKGEVAIDGPDFYKRSGLETSITLNNINKFAESMVIYIGARAFGETNNELAKCTKEGNAMGKQLMQDFFDKSLIEIRSILAAKNAVLKTASQKAPPSGSLKINSTYHNGAIKMDRYAVKIPVYKIEQSDGKSQEPANTYQEPSNNYQDTASSYQQPAANYQEPSSNTTANINPNNTADSKSNTGLIVGGIALAALPLLFYMKKSPVNTPKTGLKAPARKNKKR